MSARYVPALIFVLLAAGAVGWAASMRPATPATTALPDAGTTDAPVDEPVDAGDRARPAVRPPTPPGRSRATPGEIAGEFDAAPEADDYACEMPDVSVPEQPGCAAGEPYPSCRWQLPEEEVAGGVYRIWRNTTPEHRWAQPGLVSLVMAVARDHAYRWPGELLTIGDLDAAGPRHQTHDAGHDVDMYLENALMETNIGGGHYIDTYAGRPTRIVRMLRARVLDLAKNLATCAHGQLRIYYNDPEIITPFLAWFGDRGLTSSVGPAMVEHNRLHRFHFHMTVADGMEPLPRAR